MDSTKASIAPFMDDDGRLKQYPARRGKQLIALDYLASKFENGKRYAEREVNELLNTWHTFGDWALLRRDLIDIGLLGRNADGSEYWLQDKIIKTE
ncbi:hypothetical protein AGMMS49992_06270 [Clostridia bacterium]|nr:hypothetical protein AGMMS49992_06270 [Clostridia bacterium]